MRIIINENLNFIISSWFTFCEIYFTFFMVYKIIFLKQQFVKGIYMRQLLIGTSLAIASACLMVSCGGNSKNVTDDSLTEQSTQTTEGTSMTRIKTASGLEYEI